MSGAADDDRVAVNSAVMESASWRRVIAPRSNWPIIFSIVSSILFLSISSFLFVVPDDFATLHDKPNPLEFGDIGQGVARDSDQIGVLSLLNRSNAVLPAHRFGIGFGSCLNRSGGRQTRALHQPFKLQSLRAMRMRGAIRSSPHHDFDSLRGGRHGHSLLKNRDDSIFTPRILLIHIVHIRPCLADKAWIVIYTFRRHHVVLVLVQAKSVLDGGAP